MLTIRNEQLVSLQQAMLEAQDYTAVRHLQHHFPDATQGVTEADLLRKVRNGRLQAGRFGLLLFNDQVRFLNLCAVYGWQFWSDAKLQALCSRLSDGRISDPRERLRALVSAALTQLALNEPEEDGLKAYLETDFATATPLDSWDDSTALAEAGESDPAESMV